MACVRFLYYFDRPTRIALLRKLGRLATRYLIVQYKTSDTFKGRRSQTRCETKFATEDRGRRKYFCSDHDIAGEVREAGFQLLCVEHISWMSDRAFALIAL